MGATQFLVVEILPIAFLFFLVKNQGRIDVDENGADDLENFSDNNATGLVYYHPNKRLT